MELDVHLEEFRAMRSEILECLRFQANGITFGVSLLAAAGATLAALYVRDPTDRLLLVFLIAAIPVLAFVIGMWMVHKATLAAQIGLYIATDLRKRIEAITGVHNLLAWERFLSERSYGPHRYKPNKLLSTFGHVFFVVFMALGTWLAWFLRPSRVEPSLGLALNILIASDAILLVVFLCLSLTTSAVHRETFRESQAEESSHALAAGTDAAGQKTHRGRSLPNKH